MTLYKKREKFSGISRETGKALSKAGISPNTWTILSLIPAFITMYFLFEQDFIWASIFFAVAAFLDFVDGSVARASHRVTKYGAYLDTIVDRYVEGIVLFGLIFAGLPDFILPIAAWIFLYLFGSVMTTYVKAAAKEKELIPEGKELKGGLLERAERLLLLFLGLVLGYFSRECLTLVIVLLAVFANLSAIQRIRIAGKSTKQQ